MHMISKHYRDRKWEQACDLQRLHDCSISVEKIEWLCFLCCNPGRYRNASVWMWGKYKTSGHAVLRRILLDQYKKGSKTCALTSESRKKHITLLSSKLDPMEFCLTIFAGRNLKIFEHLSIEHLHSLLYRYFTAQMTSGALMFRILKRWFSAPEGR